MMQASIHSYPATVIPADVDKNKLLQAILDHSEETHTLMEPIKNEAGEVVDFRIIMRNRSGRAFFNSEVCDSDTLLDSYPRLVGSELIEKLKQSLETGDSAELDIEFQHDNQLLFFKDIITPIDGKVLISASNTTDAQQQKMMLEEILNTSQLYISITDAATGEYVYSNDKVADFFKQHKAEHEDAEALIRQIFHPDDVELFMSTYYNFVQQVNPDRAQIIYQAKLEDPEEYLTYQSTIISFHAHPDGTPAQLLTITQDITENKEIKRQLRKNEEHLNMAQNLSKQGSFEVDKHGYITYYTPVFLKLFALEANDLPSNLNFSFFANFISRSGAKADFNEDLRLAIASSAPSFNYKQRITDKDGNSKTLEGKAYFYYDDEGAFVKAESYIQDRTAQEELSEKLNRQEQMIATIQRMGNIGNYELDLRTGEVKYSPEQYRMLGIPQDTPMTLDAFMNLVHPDDRGKVEDAINRSIDEGVPFDEEIRILSPTRDLTILSKGAIIFDDEGQPFSLVGNTIDITERRKAQKELEEANTELKRSNEDLEQFAYIASHDLKEPLRMISAYSQLLADKLEEHYDQEATEFQNYVTEGARRMNNLINDLLKFSRIGRLNTYHEKVDLDVIVEDVLFGIKQVLDDTDAQIDRVDLPVLTVAIPYIKQLFQNLIENAIKFQRPDVQPHIELGYTFMDGQNLFWVQDNGIGIPEEHQDRIFLIFQRLHTRESYPGNGFGLALCKKIVEYHGGKIWVESKQDQGTTFFFTLPSTGIKNKYSLDAPQHKLSEQ